MKLFQTLIMLLGLFWISLSISGSISKDTFIYCCQIICSTTKQSSNLSVRCALIICFLKPDQGQHQQQGDKIPRNPNFWLELDMGLLA